MTPPLPGSLAWLKLIVDNASRIYVRAQIDGKWDSVAFDTLPADDQAEYVVNWLEDGRTPVYLLNDPE